MRSVGLCDFYQLTLHSRGRASLKEAKRRGTSLVAWGGLRAEICQPIGDILVHRQYTIHQKYDLRIKLGSCNDALSENLIDVFDRRFTTLSLITVVYGHKSYPPDRGNIIRYDARGY